MPNKYLNKRTLYKGIMFDSKLEAFICRELDILGLKYKLQPVYILVDGFVFKGKKECPIKYVADFDVDLGTGVPYTIDVKGVQTSIFKLKRKLFQKVYDRDIVIIKSVADLRNWYDEVRLVIQTDVYDEGGKDGQDI